MQKKQTNKKDKGGRRFKLKSSTDRRLHENPGTTDTLRTVVRMGQEEQRSTVALWMCD